MQEEISACFGLLHRRWLGDPLFLGIQPRHRSVLLSCFLFLLGIASYEMFGLWTGTKSREDSGALPSITKVLSAAVCFVTSLARTYSAVSSPTWTGTDVPCWDAYLRIIPTYLQYSGTFASDHHTL